MLYRKKVLVHSVPSLVVNDYINTLVYTIGSFCPKENIFSYSGFITYISCTKRQTYLYTTEFNIFLKDDTMTSLFKCSTNVVE